MSELFFDVYCKIAYYIDDSYTWRSFMLASKTTNQAGYFLVDEKKKTLKHRIGKTGNLVIIASKMLGVINPTLKGYDKQVESDLQSGKYNALMKDLNGLYEEQNPFVTLFVNLATFSKYCLPIIDFFKRLAIIF